MREVNLGELSVSALGLGCMGMSQSYGNTTPAESERTLHRALDLGVTFLDTANAYGNGHNEELIGRVLSERRNEFVLASKFGLIRHPDGSRSIDGHPDRVEKHCEDSLRRLKTDVIDLYYLHRVDPKVPIEDTVGAMADLVIAGKIRYLGLSEISTETLYRAHAVHTITAVQSEYSLWTRDPEAKILGACAKLGIGFVPFSPLGRAMLTGRLRDTAALTKNDLRLTMPRFLGDNFASNFSLVQKLIAFADQKDCTGAQLSLAWLLAQGDGIAPIPGTKKVNYLEENIAAINLNLGQADIEHLDTIFAPGKIAGDRYAPAMMAIVRQS
ncbi:MAG TPA: aldo/keto reductase [Gammaproteobacteria bacterium]|nr:aldo/keto reductase [Gammaproteobacteria bacterium]|tara:strand:+ start:551 stop:1531 length:981 start_codon:yes stop_codon:yes gene_type:complete